MPNFSYSDVDAVFGINPFSGDITPDYDTAAINNSITNLIFTKNYERPFLEYLNCGIEQELFELINSGSANNIQTKISGVLKTFEPRIINVVVTVTPNQAENGYDCTIYYLPRNSLQTQTVNLFLQRII